MLARWRWWAYPLAALFALGVIGALVFGFAALVTIRALPSLDALTDYRPKVPLRVYSAEGILIGEFGEERRQVVKIDSVPLRLKQAILAAEDDRFYQHGGVDYTGILRAAYSNFTSGGLRQGASTITMQVARALEPRKRNISSKMIEMFRAFQLEWKYSKNEILQMYLNLVPYGGNIEGVKSASLLYFSKNPDHLSLAEITALSIIPNRPSSLVMGKNNDRIIQERNRWLRKFATDKVFTEKEIEDALAEPLTATRNTVPHFAKHLSNKLYNKGGYYYKTHLDLNTQLKNRKDSRRLYKGPAIAQHK